jgi:hypothetical protein
VSGVDPYVRDTDSLVWLNKQAFDIAAPQAGGRFGTLGWNALRGPTAFNWDMGLHKTFQVAEEQRITFRFELFNALNHANFNNPNPTVTNVNFGKILSAQPGRSIQLALKYVF